MDEPPNFVPGSAGLAEEVNWHIIALAHDLTPPVSRDERSIGLFASAAVGA